jgi:hypothetical protein
MRKQISKVDPNLPDGPGDAERAADELSTEEAEERGSQESEGSEPDEPPTR